MALKKWNRDYQRLLATNPLLTKSVTAGVFAGLNEVIASCLTGDFKESVVGERKVKHVFTPKLLKMVIYGMLIITPLSHNMYGALNKVFKGPNLSRKMKILQVIASLSTITPTLSAVFTSWLAFVNNYSFPDSLRGVEVSQELKKIKDVVVTGLKKSYFSILKSSVVTSTIILVIAQNFLDPNLWVVFFNLVYFVLGTIQNTKVKKLQARLKKEEETDDSHAKQD